MRTYFAVIFEIDDHLYRCVWYTEERDGFLLEGNRLKRFDSWEDLIAYDKQQDLHIVTEESLTISIDRLRGQFEQIDNAGALDCHEFLNFWNFVSNDGAYFVPTWTKADKKQLKKVFGDGVQLLKSIL